MRKGLGEPLPNVARFFDADSFCTHRFGNLGEIGVLEFHSERDEAGLLLFDVDEIEGPVVEDLSLIHI